MSEKRELSASVTDESRPDSASSRRRSAALYCACATADAISCAVCGSGSFSSGLENSACDLCPAGTYSSAGASDCAACHRFPHFGDYDMGSLPDDFDWRALGAVTDVKNQKYCGSCWSFSSAGDIEGTMFLAGDDLISLSTQQLVSCNTYNYGCDGGWLCVLGWVP